MSDPDTTPARQPRKRVSEPASAPAPAPAAPEVPKDTRTAKIRTKENKVPAKGFTFAKGVVVPGVPLAHAEYLRDAGKAEILEVTA